MSTLLEDIQQWYADGETSPPTYDRTFNLVGEEVLEGKRWGDLKQWVFEKDGKFVAVVDVEPATEYQDWGDYGPPEVYEVEPYEVVEVRYRKRA